MQPPSLRTLPHQKSGWFELLPHPSTQGHIPSWPKGEGTLFWVQLHPQPDCGGCLWRAKDVLPTTQVATSHCTTPQARGSQPPVRAQAPPSSPRVRCTTGPLHRPGHCSQHGPSAPNWGGGATHQRKSGQKEIRRDGGEGDSGSQTGGGPVQRGWGHVPQPATRQNFFQEILLSLGTQLCSGAFCNSRCGRLRDRRLALMKQHLPSRRYARYARGAGYYG